MVRSSKIKSFTDRIYGVHYDKIAETFIIMFNDGTPAHKLRRNSFGEWKFGAMMLNDNNDFINTEELVNGRIIKFRGQYFDSYSIIGVIAYIAKHGKVGDFNYCGVNHKDNSGKYRFYDRRKREVRRENLNLSNLELYFDQNLNTRHGRVWHKIMSCGICSSFSCYNDKFIKYITKLANTGSLCRETIMKWPHTTDYRGTYYFK